tara:strand:+ start:310 stop:3216 length:2907 start_codon:yes stop_codon:yes gene_type:complete
MVKDIAPGYFNYRKAAEERADLQQQALSAEKKMREQQDFRRFGLGVAESLLGSAIKIGANTAQDAIQDALFGERKAIGELRDGAAYEYAMGLAGGQAAPASSTQPLAPTGLPVSPLASPPAAAGAKPQASKSAEPIKTKRRGSEGEKVYRMVDGVLVEGDYMGKFKSPTSLDPKRQAVVKALGLDKVDDLTFGKELQTPAGRAPKIVEGKPSAFADIFVESDSPLQPLGGTTTGLEASAADVRKQAEEGLKVESFGFDMTGAPRYRPLAKSVRGVTEGAVRFEPRAGQPLPSSDLPSEALVNNTMGRRQEIPGLQLSNKELVRRAAEFRDDVELDPSRQAEARELRRQRGSAEQSARTALGVVRRKKDNIAVDVSTIKTKAPIETEEGQIEFVDQAIGLKPAISNITASPGAPTATETPQPVTEQDIARERSKVSALIPSIARRTRAVGPQFLPDVPTLSPEQLANLNPQQMQAYYRGKAFVRKYNDSLAALQTSAEKDRLSLELMRVKISEAQRGPGIDPKELRASRKAVYDETAKYNPLKAKTVFDAIVWQNNNSKKPALINYLGPNNSKNIMPTSAVDFLISTRGLPVEQQKAAHEFVSSQLSPEAYSRVLRGEHHVIARPMNPDEIREQKIAFDNARRLKATKPEGKAQGPASQTPAESGGGVKIKGFPFYSIRTDGSGLKVTGSPTAVTKRKGLSSFITNMSKNPALYVVPGKQDEWQDLLKVANEHAVAYENGDTSEERINAYNSAMDAAYRFQQRTDVNVSTAATGPERKEKKADAAVEKEKDELRGLRSAMRTTQTDIDRRKAQLLSAAVRGVDKTVFDKAEIEDYILAGTKPLGPKTSDELIKSSGLERARAAYQKAISFSDEKGVQDSDLKDLRTRMIEQRNRRKELKAKYPDIKGASLDPRAQEEKNKAIAALTPGQRALFDVIDRRTDLSAAQKAQLFRDLIYGTGTGQVSQRMMT